MMIMIIIMMMMIIILLLIIIISLKGAIRDFVHSPHCAANCLQHMRSSGQSTINRLQITCNTSVYADPYVRNALHVAGT